MLAVEQAASSIRPGTMNRRAQLYSFFELWRHYRNCRRNERNTLNALRFETDAEANLLGSQWADQPPASAS